MLNILKFNNFQNKKPVLAAKNKENAFCGKEQQNMSHGKNDNYHHMTQLLLSAPENKLKLAFNTNILDELPDPTEEDIRAAQEKLSKTINVLNELPDPTEEDIRAAQKKLSKTIKEIEKLKGDTFNKICATSDDAEKIKITINAINEIAEKDEEWITGLHNDLTHDFGNCITPKGGFTIRKLQKCNQDEVDVTKLCKQGFNGILRAHKEYNHFLENADFSSPYSNFNTALTFADILANNLKKELTINCEGKNLLKESSFNIKGPKLFYIFSNLIQNSVKYTPKDGSGVIDMKFEKNDKMLKFTIYNNGLSIKPEDRKKVLKGKRTEEAQKSGIPGTGYGLAKIKADVERKSGGNFSIVDPLDEQGNILEGTKIIIELPLKPE